MTIRTRLGVRRRLVFVAATIGLALVGRAALAGAQQAEPTSTLSSSPASGAGGSSIALHGTCRIGSQPATAAVVHLTSQQIPAGSEPVNIFVDLTVASDGTFQGAIGVPVDAPAGTYAVSLACFSGDQEFGDKANPFTVTSSAAPTTSAPSPTTTTTVPGARRATPRTGTPRFAG
jgi:hypothetical protein